MTDTTTTPTKTKILKRFSGTVVSDKNEKTIVVEVARKLRHKLYGKSYTRSRRFQVHDEKNQYAVGDTVDFVECRPLSRHKRWRVVYPITNKA